MRQLPPRQLLMIDVYTAAALRHGGPSAFAGAAQGAAASLLSEPIDAMLDRIEARRHDEAGSRDQAPLTHRTPSRVNHPVSPHFRPSGLALNGIP